MMRKYSRISLPLILAILLAGCSSEKNTNSAAPTEGEPLTSYSQQITSPTRELQMKVGDTVMVDVNVKNTGTQSWFAGSKPGWVDASYRWISNGVELPIEGERTSLSSREVKPGESSPLKVKVVAPPNPGAYTLWISLVQEGFAWFYTKGTQPLILQVTVD